MVEFIAFIKFYTWLLIFYGYETNVAILVKYKTPKRGVNNSLKTFLSNNFTALYTTTSYIQCYLSNNMPFINLKTM